MSVKNLMESLRPYLKQQAHKIPVNPEHFLDIVTSELASNNVVVTKQTLRVLRRLCLLLNFSIQNIKIQKAKVPVFKQLRTFVYPAQTGIGKSVSLQVYAALLAKYQRRTTLIVVSKVSEAIRYCENINRLVGEDNYAMCFYRVSSENPYHELKAETLRDLNFVKCAVITHSLFSKAKGYQSLSEEEVLKVYKSTKNERYRDLVVIDENIDFFRDYRVNVSQIKGVRSFVDKALSCFSELNDDPSSHIVSTSLIALENFVVDTVKAIKPDTYVSVVDELTFFDYMAEREIPLRQLGEHFEGFSEKCFEKFAVVLKEASPSIAKSRFEGFFASDMAEFKSNLERIIYNLTDSAHGLHAKDGEFQDFVIGKLDGGILLRVEGFLNLHGSTVVLDATAQVNKFYEVASKSLMNPMFTVKAPQVRKYENLVIYKARGYSQSRYEFYGKGEEYLKLKVKEFLSYAYSVLSDQKDKMLLICHKSMRDHFKKQCKDKRIVFTHWGDHVGKNDWSDCNKVLLAGWNTLNEYSYLTSIYNAGSSVMDIRKSKAINNGLIQEFKVSKLVDDIVQAVMRTRARVIATADTDCLATSIYLFYPDNNEGREVIQLVESQFPQAQLVDWVPQGISKPKKKSKPEENADLVLSILDAKSSAGIANISRKQVREESKLRPSDFSKAVNSDYFNNELVERKYSVGMINKKDKKFVF